MKKFILAASILAISVGIALPVYADAPEATADQIANLARNGYFKEEGIPGFASLSSAMRMRQVTGADIVQAAIKQKRIHADRATDAHFIRHVVLAAFR
jgi:hypothetical protein